MRRNCLSLCLTLLLTLLVVCPVDAAASNTWKVDKIGTFDVPQGWEATDMWEVGKLIQSLVPQQATLTKEGIPAVLPGGKTNPFAQLENGNLRIYYIALNDGKTYRTAAAIFFNDDVPMKALDQRYFGEKITTEQRKELESAIREFDETLRSKLPFIEPTTKSGLKMFELTPVEYLKINGRQAYGEGARIIATAYGMTLPYYIKGYTFNNQEHLTLAIFLTSDSERTYWEPIFRKMMRTLH